ncbi:CROCC [Mytilus edulis]|uniref:CROCC n=1 Tax=Mytilus edulis TaxID=6550 RepID=A0A8S3V0T1_MYTED|nr:CROCC [Mytilus edulis]
MAFEDRDQRLERVIQRLEDSVLKEVDDYTIRGEDSNPSKIPARIREIITKNLSPDDIDIPSNRMSTPNTGQLTEENRILAAELNRVEDLLAASRAERDELGIKYNALSDKLEQNLKEKRLRYKRKLQAYQDGQQRQAQLVQKLQAKVLQYKKKCEEIEVDNSDIKSRYDHLKSLQSQQDSYHKGLDSESRLRQEAENNMDHESALIKLEEEQQRSASLAHVNSMLREQLDQATAANQSLTNDIHKLTNDWQRAREELEGKEAEWREEEQSFNEYFSNEHGRLLSLWREVVAFRRSFGELKTATERDMSHLRSDVTKASRSMHSACLNLSANQRSSDTQLSVLLDREKQERMSLENQLRDKNREIGELQSRYDTHSAELNSKVNELTMLNEKLKIQAEEHNKTISNLQRNINNLETRLGEQRSYDLPETESSRQYREETDVIHEALRNIAEAVINDADELDAEGGRRSVSPSRNRSMSPTARARSPILRNRSKSPMARSRSPAFADATFSAVQAALNKRQLPGFRTES